MKFKIIPKDRYFDIELNTFHVSVYIHKNNLYKQDHFLLVLYILII